MLHVRSPQIRSYTATLRALYSKSKFLRMKKDGVMFSRRTDVGLFEVKGCGIDKFWTCLGWIVTETLDIQHQLLFLLCEKRKLTYYRHTCVYRENITRQKTLCG